MHKPNNLLEFDVRDTLDWDPEIDGDRIVVKADDGQVTLTGSVTTYHDKLRATQDAWTVGGVKKVENELLVGRAGAAINDAELAAACAQALDHDRLVPKGAVSVTAKDGKVQLRGRVRHHYQSDAAEWAVSHVDGMLAMENLIAISSEPIPSDIADRIHKAFQRSAIIDDSKIRVTNDGHTVYLDGIVGSYAAMREAEDTTWAAPGVESVVTNLVIEP
jgi:osmotically-inducible protein OsmY